MDDTPITERLTASFAHIVELRKALADAEQQHHRLEAELDFQAEVDAGVEHILTISEQPQPVALSELLK